MRSPNYSQVTARQVRWIMKRQMTDQQPAIPIRPQPRDCRILVVDDNEDAAVSMAMLLESDGHQTRCAYSGMQALQIGESFRPHLVLMDIEMPGMNGYETASRIRSRPWGASLVLAALSGSMPSDDELALHSAEFDHQVIKPARLSQIEALVAIAQAAAIAR